MQPKNPKVGLIGFVPDVWGGIWQPRHQVLTRLAHHFQVVWMDPARNWRNAWLPVSSESSPEWQSMDEFPSFTVYRHGFLTPHFYRPTWLGKFTEWRRLKNAKDYLIEQGCTKFVAYLWRPEFASCLEHGLFDVSCYHVDDEYNFSDTELPLDAREKDLIAGVDQVIIHSPALYEKKGNLNNNTAVVPNGVDFNRFSMRVDLPSDMEGIKRPIMGYVGVVQSTIDWELMLALATGHAEWSFVFVGPRGHLDPVDIRMLEQLDKLSNVFFLGGKSVELLPSYVQHMDVCMMPYKVNGYTKFIYPLKLHEYLGSGRPTVGTPIRSLLDFESVIKVANGVESWSVALRDSLGPDSNSPDQVSKRQNVARKNDWNVHVDKIASELLERLTDL